MLSISAMTGGQERYYTELAREDYYLEGGEPPGRWFGKGAEKLGLIGHVEQEHLSSLFRGFAPDDRKLVLNAGKANRQPGWDLTFSAPKSVSTLWSQAPESIRQAIQEAHYESVRVASGYLETAAGVTRRGHGGIETERVGLVVALYEHGTSRAQDPQLHTHALFMNMAIRADGTWGTIRSHDLYEHKMTAGALYRAELAYRLSHDLGLSIKQEKTWFELKGVPCELMDEFSTRRAEIEDALDSSDLRDAKAAELAALSTRTVKKHVARDDLFSHWHETGDDHGFSMSKAEKLIQCDAAQSRDPSELARESVDELTKNRSFFLERDVVRHMAESAQDGSLSARDITSAARDGLASEKILQFEDKQKPDRICFTTRELYELERDVLEAADRLRSDTRHAASDNIVKKVFNNRSFQTLSDEQREAVRHITQNDGAIQCISGMAGTGKTFTLAAAHEVWKKEGFEIVGCALAAKAARELEAGSGIQSDTLAMTLKRLDPTVSDRVTHHSKQVQRAALGKRTYALDCLKLDQKTVVVLDEAGMVGTRDFAQLTKYVDESGAKLVLAGDAAQLPSIAAGAPYRSIIEKIGTAELIENRRQREPWMRDAVKLLAEGDARGALSLYAKAGCLDVSPTRDKATAQLIHDWKDGRTKDLKETLILASTNVEATQLNQRAQAARRDAGELGFRRAKHDGVAFFEGDRILMNKNRRTLDISNGDIGTIEHIAVGLLPGSSSLTVRLDRTEGKGLFNKSKRVTFKLAEYSDFSLGYAVTTHKAQGATVDRTFILAGSSMQDRELSYVQASRARESTRFFASESDAGEDLVELVRQMGRSHQQELAHDRELREHERTLKRSID